MKESAALRKEDTGRLLERLSARGLAGLPSTCAISSSATSRPIPATKNFWPGRRSAPRRCGQNCSRTSRKKGRRACWPSMRKRPRPCWRTRPAISIATTRSSSACRPISRSSGRSFPYGGLRMVEAGLKAAGFEADPQVHEAFTKYRKVAQRRRVRRLHAGNHAVPEVRHHHRPSGCLWPRPHHRRLPPRRALRRRSPARGQARGARADRRHVADRRSDPACARSWPSRFARSKISRRWQSSTIATFRARQRMPRRRSSGLISLISARSRKPTARRCRSAASRASSISTSSATCAKARWTRPGPGAVGPAGAEAPHRALPAHAGLRRAVQRRSLLGDRMRRRHGSRRPPAGDQEQLSHAAHPLQSRAGAGAEHHGAVVEAYAGEFQALLRQGQPRYVVAAVRKRRPDAAVLGRRLRHRLLRLGDAAWQADAVLRRARQSRQGAALRHQRRPRRDLRRPDRAADAAGHRRGARL